MLEKAKDKNVYKELININILDLELDEVKKPRNFDFIISCGVFLEGHVPFTIFTKLKELVKYNIIFTVRETFIPSRNDEYSQYVKENKNYKDYDIEYLNNVKCIISCYLVLKSLIFLLINSFLELVKKNKI